MTLEAGGKICIGTISETDYDETGVQGISGELLTTHVQSKVSRLSSYRRSWWSHQGKSSKMRMKYRLDQVAAKFSGGGHAAAAGLNVEMDHDTFRAELLAELKADCSRRIVFKGSQDTQNQPTGVT